MKSDQMDETEQELLDIEQSWVDMSLLNPGKVDDSEVKEGEMVAFNWADGGSIKTMTSAQQEPISDAKTSVVNSSDEESGSEAGSGSTGDEDEESFNSARESEEEEVVDLADSDDESEGPDPMNLEEKLWTDIADLEDPVMELFHDNEEERDDVWNMLLAGVVTSNVLKWAENIGNVLI
jgi:hypothetical protein